MNRSTCASSDDSSRNAATASVYSVVSPGAASKMVVSSSIGEKLFVGSDPGSPFQIEFLEVHAVGNAKAIEHDEFRWVSLVELRDYEFAPVDHQFVKHWLNAEIGLND